MLWTVNGKEVKSGNLLELVENLTIGSKTFAPICTLPFDKKISFVEQYEVIDRRDLSDEESDCRFMWSSYGACYKTHVIWTENVLEGMEPTGNKRIKIVLS